MNVIFFRYTGLLLTSFILLLLVFDFEWEIPLEITIFLFAIYHLILFAKYIYLKNSDRIILNFLFVVLLIPLLLKINYIYYNLLFPILLVILGIYVKNKIGLSLTLYKNIFYFLISLNVLIIFIPDKQIMIYRLNDQITWNPEITWDNFKDRREENNFDAGIFTNFNGNVNRVYNYPPAIVFSTMSENKSWISENFQINTNKSLLNHEQKHFDVMEIFARKAQDSTNKLWGKNPSKIKETIMYFKKEANLFNKIYDESTSHGDKKNEQKIFDEKIFELLNE